MFEGLPIVRNTVETSSLEGRGKTFKTHTSGVTIPIPITGSVSDCASLRRRFKRGSSPEPALAKRHLTPPNERVDCDSLTPPHKINLLSDFEELTFGCPRSEAGSRSPVRESSEERASTGSTYDKSIPVITIQEPESLNENVVLAEIPRAKAYTRTYESGLQPMPPLLRGKHHEIKEICSGPAGTLEMLNLPKFSSSEEAGILLDAIIKRVFLYTWKVNVKPLVTRERLEIRIAHCFLEQMQSDLFIGKLDLTTGGNDCRQIGRCCIAFIQNSSTLLREILERINLLRETLKCQLLMLGHRTLWTDQLNKHLSALSIDIDEYGDYYPRGQTPLDRFVKAIDELQSLDSIDPVEKRRIRLTHSFLFKALGESSDEIQKVSDLLHKWSPSEKEFPGLLDEVTENILQMLQSKKEEGIVTSTSEVQIEILSEELAELKNYADALNIEEGLILKS